MCTRFYRGLLACCIFSLLLATAAVADGDRVTVEPSPAAPAAAHFYVSRIDAHGNTVVPSSELDAALQPFFGRELTFADLQKANTAVEAVYRRHGFVLASAYVPPQSITNGIIQMQIVEGRLGKVKVLGNHHYSSRFLARQMTTMATDGGVIQQTRLQRALLVLNEMPNLQVKGLLQPGEAPGTSDLVLDVQDRSRLHGSFEYNNFGSQFTGQERVELDLIDGNLTGRGDGLALKTFSAFPGPNESPTFQLGYSRPINDNGLRLNALYGNSDQVIADSLQALNINGQTSYAFLGLSQALTRTLTTSSDVSVTLQSKTFSNLILGNEASHDEIRDLQGSFSLNRTRRRGTDSLNFAVTEGLGTLLGGTPNGDPLASRAGAGSSFTKLDLDLTRYQSLGRWGLLMRGSAQWASTPLTVGEQFAVGGADSVRGFQQSTVLGDDGYSVSAELRMPFNGRPGAPEGVLFVDRGSTRILNPAVGQAATQELTGAGPGVRFQLGQTSVRVDLGFPMQGTTTGPVLYTQLINHF